jgi:secreted PhoX family phosphatase
VFHDDLTGEWKALTPETTGMDAAEIAIFTRMAASAVGATTMDRPEWIAVNPGGRGLLLPDQQPPPRRAG